MKKFSFFFGKIWSSLWHPVATCRMVNEERLQNTLLYLVLLLIFPAVLLTIGSVIIYPRFMAPYVGNYSLIGWVGILLVIIFVFVLSFASLLVSGVVMHIPVRILGGKNGLKGSVRAIVYGSTPFVLSIWFPPIIIFTGVWSTILTIVWVRDIHQLHAWKAIVSVILPPVLVVVLSLIVTALY